MGSVSLINGHIDPDESPEERLTKLNDELELLVDSFYDGVYLCQSKEIDGDLPSASPRSLRDALEILSIGWQTLIG